METNGTLQDTLASLEGKTADEIAAMMRRRGVKGRAGTTRKCPLAQFFSNLSTGQFLVGATYIMRITGGGPNPHEEKAKTPKNLKAFLTNFDKGKYPDLLAPPPRCVIKDPRPDDRHADPKAHHKKRKPTRHSWAKDVERFGGPR